MDPVRFAETFLAGRAKSTFPTYDLAFRKLWSGVTEEYFSVESDGFGRLFGVIG